MKNILISGGAGFIGINLIQYILDNDSNNKIIVIDNFITSDKNRFVSFKQQYTDDQIMLYEADICNIDIKSELAKINIYNIDEIYHLASLASPPAYKNHSVQTLDVGYNGTKYLLQLARSVYNAKFLFASTSEVYGDSLITPQHEAYYGNVNSYGERSCYDESKRIGEALCYTFRHKYCVDVKIARIFNTYGPYMLLNDGRIITEIIKSLKNNSKLTIYGDGTQTRSYCYVVDTVAMLVKLMNSDINIPVNIGNDNDEKTINDTTDYIESIWNEMYNTNVKINRVYNPLTQNDPLQRRPCLQLNRQLLGDHKYTTFADGVKKTIEYFNGL
jgi:nucleoside-diphosphate-sugar epimerase